MSERIWRRVVLACECEECSGCGDPWCPECDMHYAECDCPGPHQSDEFEYETRANGALFARRLDHPP